MTGTAVGDATVSTAYLGLGTNLGDRAANLGRALSALRRVGRVAATSAVYETDPVGYAEQPVFWNLVARLETHLTPAGLLARLQVIERSIGRTPTFRMGPRMIDIDLLLYDDVVLDDGALAIPHPALLERAFVLVPLLELTATLHDPRTGASLAACLARIDTAGVRRLGSVAELLVTPPERGT